MSSQSTLNRNYTGGQEKRGAHRIIGLPISHSAIIIKYICSICQKINYESLFSSGNKTDEFDRNSVEICTSVGGQRTQMDSVINPTEKGFKVRVRVTRESPNLFWI
jgi:hypothetical protein